MRKHLVTLHARVWIETEQDCRIKQAVEVTLHARVWIETPNI